MIRAIMIACALLAPSCAYASNSVRITGVAAFKDGDSGHVGDTPIRLWCIDAPEYRTREGRKAAAFAARRINDHLLICEQRQRAKSYGRIVAKCVFASGRNRGESVSQLLIDEGYAHVWSPPKGRKNAAEIAAACAEAARNGDL